MTDGPGVGCIDGFGEMVGESVGNGEVGLTVGKTDGWRLGDQVGRGVVMLVALISLVGMKVEEGAGVGAKVGSPMQNRSLCIHT